MTRVPDTTPLPLRSHATTAAMHASDVWWRNGVRRCMRRRAGVRCRRDAVRRPPGPKWSSLTYLVVEARVELGCAIVSPHEGGGALLHGAGLSCDDEAGGE
jgi:hypothetical protein